MTVAAQIQLTQGGQVGTPGQAIEGTVGTPVVVANTNNANVVTWTFTVIDAPPASAITRGQKQTGATPTWTFTPDVPDAFLIQLTVSDGAAPPNTSTDYRMFESRRATGRFIPPFMGTAASMNVAGQTRGWAPSMEDWLDYLDGLLPAIHGIITVTHSGAGTLDSTHQIAKVTSTTGTTTVNAPVVAGSIGAGWQIAVFDDTNAAAANVITVSGNGKQIESPLSPGTLAATVQIAANSAFVQWMYEGTYWKLMTVAAIGGGGGGGGGGLAGVITVTHAATGILDATHQIAKVTSSSGTTTTNAPAIGGAVGLGWQILVFDDTNTAAGNFITVSGNGVNIEDPNAPGTFAATVQMKTSSSACMWMYDGAQWKLVASFYAVNLASAFVSGVLPWANGGREQGELHVTNGTSPGTLSATVQLAYMESSTGATAVNMPATPTANLTALVVDTDGAAGTSAITVHPNGNPVEDPGNPGSFTTSDISLHSAGVAVIWRWDATRGHWKVVSSTNSTVGGGGGPGAVLSATGALLPTDAWKLFSAGPYTIFLPTGPVVGFTQELTQVGTGSIAGAGLVTVHGNGKPVYDPQNSLAVPTGFASLRTDGRTFGFRYDGTAFRSVRNV